MANNKKYFYITTPIYYASGTLHIGHAYSNCIADSIARYERMTGKEVRFLTGSDEHGQKIEEKAKALNETPQQFVDDTVKGFKETWKLLDITYDDFIRTTDERHVKVVKKVFTRLLNQGDIYLGQYSGWYCTPCESFYTQTQLIQPGNLCPSCKRPCHQETEEAYFLNCKKYTNQLLQFYKDHPEFSTENRINEMINTFIKPGLDDLCITRTSFNWGIPTNENPKHVIYVWIDALLNYVSSLGYLSEDDTLFNEYWGPDSEIVQLLGADITRFHLIYWPILLFALNLRCPDRMLAHGLLLTHGGIKLSKSFHNAVEPKVLVDRYGLDAFRWYMVRGVKFGEQGQFTPTLFVNLTNTDLANGYGNLVNRTINMIKKYDDCVVPSYADPILDFTKKLYSDVAVYIKQYNDAWDNFDVTAASGAAMSIVNAANKYVDDAAPWNLSKEGKTAEIDEVMHALTYCIRVASITLKPFLVTKADMALDELNVPEDQRQLNTINDYKTFGNIKTNDPIPLFPRLKKDEEIKWLEDLFATKGK